MKVKCDHRSEFSNLSNWKEEAWKKKKKNQGFNGIRTHDLREYRCDALPTELWSHTLGARSIYWVHIFPCSEIMWSIYEIIHICTAVVDESEVWSSQWIFQFKQLERRSLKKKKKKKIRASTGFEPMTSANTGAMLYQLSYEATHWEQGQFIEFISSRAVKSCEVYMKSFIFVLR